MAVNKGKAKMRKPTRKNKMSDKALFELVERREKNKERLSRIQQDIDTDNQAIIKEMQGRGIKAIETDRFRVTLTSNESTVYDADALWEELTPAQRRAVFDENVNLNGLKGETRKKVIQAVPKRELAAVTTHALVTEKLSAEVQAGNIPLEVIEEHSEVESSKPYIRVSERN